MFRWDNKNQLNQKELMPLDSFKKMGTKLVKELDQPVLVSLNLRNLKYFNEIYGTKKGDWLIRYMGEFYFEQNNNCVLGSLSYADHLLLLCEGHNQNEEELIACYEEMGKQFIEHVNEKYGRAKVHVDCGLYIMKEGDSFLYAQDNARYARRSIKNSRKMTVAFYSEELRQQSMKKASIIPNFERAIERNEICVMLQPKYSVKENKIIGAEALSRMLDEGGNAISPAIFVPVLEKAGIISELDFEVFRQVVALLKRWKEEGKTLFPISINLSRIDMIENKMFEKMDQIVEEEGIPKECIEFELTETAVVENLEEIVAMLGSLREKGYRIALDDFGSGYNSLYVLGKIPANVIKFDRGFVVHAIHDAMGTTIMKNLVETFKEIKFEVLCEGVETEEEKQYIVACGCDVIQGYLYDKPMSISDFEKKYVK